MEAAGAVDANEYEAFLRILYVVHRLGREHDGLERKPVKVKHIIVSQIYQCFITAWQAL